MPVKRPVVDRCLADYLERVAGSKGVRFERSYTPVSLCCPARAMLLGGAWSWHNGVFVQVHVPQRMHFGMKLKTNEKSEWELDEEARENGDE